MPELPDVEFMRQRVAQRVRAKRIRHVRIEDTNFVGFSQAAARAQVENATITAARRRGKFLLLFLDSGYALLLHMGMTGELYLAKPSDEVEGRVRLRLALEGGPEIRYSTVRKLGRIALAKGRDLRALKELAHLGAEPLSSAFRPQRFQTLAASYRSTVKSLLMSQKKIAGIGNIYSDEILFQAGVHPAVRAHTLSESELHRIHNAVRRVLRDAARDPVKLHRKKSWLVNRRSGASRCPRCQAPIHRQVIAGRSSYFCSRCQRGRDLGLKVGSLRPRWGS